MNRIVLVQDMIGLAADQLSFQEGLYSMEFIRNKFEIIKSEVCFLLYGIFFKVAEVCMCRNLYKTAYYRWKSC
jgi:hypothetical protein